MSLQNKRRVFALAGILILLLVIISISLPGLRLKEGEPLPLGRPQAGMGGAANLGGGELFLLVIRGILALGILLLPVYILTSLMTPEGRKRLLAEIILLTSIVLLALWLSQNASQQVDRELEQPESELVGQELPFGEMGGQEMPVFEAKTPNWMVTLTVLISALALSILMFLVTRRVLRAKPAPGELDQLAEQAQKAVRSIGMGLNFENIILQCYAEMTQTIERSRGIQRGSAMTPLEFQQYLEKSGVPAEPVRRLTHLFETVRYGHQPIDDRGKREAVESLNQIIAYCRSLG